MTTGYRLEEGYDSQDIDWRKYMTHRIFTGGRIRLTGYRL